MIVTRYLTKEVLNALLTVTIILLLAFLSQQIVRYLSYVAIGKIPTSVLLELVSFEIPYLLAILLPLGLYLGIMLAYGRLYSNSEMAILHMYGFDRRRVLGLTAIIALVVAGFVLILMLWINPIISAKRQQVMASDEATVHLVQTIMPGRFQISPDGRHVMYVEKLSRDRQRAKNVFLAQEKKNIDDNKQNTWMLVFADEGYQTKDKVSPGQLFVMTNGYRYEGIPGQNDYQIIQFGKYIVRIPQSNMHVTHQENEALSTLQLLQNYDNPKRAAELQWRFSIALSTLLLALLAVQFCALRPRQGRYFALLPAILIYIVYINLLSIARRWVEQGTIPIPLGMWWVHGIILFFVVVIIFINMKRWK